MKNLGEKGAWAYPGTAQFFCVPPYYLRNVESYRFQIWPVHSEGPSEQKPIKILEKRERGRIQGGTAQIFGYPLLSQERGKLQISNLAWSVHSEGPSEQKPIKNIREKGAWAYPGTAQFFRVPPIISGTGKATDFKFSHYIQRVHPNKGP